ncbi:MAG: ABC transporter ATP-binding protein [Firmicutes bacterium]|nr:ABC transporter ATP-binding protein [Bacillota bacterium]
MLSLRNINKSYDEGKLEVPVLHDISLDIEEGEYVAIMGPSGSGKSTLMNIIGCLDVATSGEYILDGENIEGKTDNEMSEIRNKTIGFVFQNFNLLPRETALENVALPMLYGGVPRSERLKRAEEALRKVGLEDRMDFFPTQLSGGQKQRVAIARAIVNRPKLLLADEPTGALDTASGMQVIEIFKELNEKEGMTIVMITHEKEVADHARRQMVIRDGRLHQGRDIG